MEAKKRITKDSKARRLAYNEGYQAGIKEVVEFTSPLMGKISVIIADIRGDWIDPRQNCRDAHQLIAEWQAKLKDWKM